MHSFSHKILNFFKKLIIFPFLVILFAISYLNKFPEGYTYSYSDFAQFVNTQNKIRWFSDTLIDSSEGKLNFLYAPFYYVYMNLIQGVVGLEYMAVVYCFTFLFGSFLSFYFAAIFYGLYKEKNKASIYCFSLLYAINAYTVIRFRLPSIYFLPYVFLPLLFSTVHSYFRTEKIINRQLLWCALVMILSNICWAGPPYFIAYSLLVSIYICIILIFYWNFEPLKTIKKLSAFYLIYTCCFAMYLFTWPPLLLGYIADIQTGEQQENMKEWLFSQSLSLIDIFTFASRLMGLVNIRDIYVTSFILFSFSFFILFSKIFLSKISAEQKKITLVFGFMIFATIFFLNKGKGLPGEIFIHNIFYSNAILCSLRSFDKTLIFMPFFIIMPYCLYSINSGNKIFAIVLVVFAIMLSYPLLNGNFYKKHSAVEDGKDYMTSRYSSLIKIPQEYFDVINRTNSIKGDFRVLSLPWSLDNHDLTGWILSPKWKNAGWNPVIQYFNRPFVHMNDPTGFRQWNYGAIWNSQGINESVWLMKLAGLLNANYVIYQKDILHKFVNQTISKIEAYKTKNYLQLLTTNSFFDFYKVNNEFYLPHFYSPDSLHIIEESKEIPTALITEKSSHLKKPAILNYISKEMINVELTSPPNIEYKKITASKYIIKFHGITKSFPLIFSDSFFGFWKIYPKRFNENLSEQFEKYTVFKDNDEYQATHGELKSFIENGWISEIGNAELKRRKIISWKSQKIPEKKYEYYHFDFISKNIKGTIQNDNIRDGNMFHTLFLDSIDEKYHCMANGYANFWFFDINYLKENFKQVLNKNKDGTYDFEVILEFWPQKVLNICRIFVICFTFFVLISLMKIYVPKIIKLTR